MNPKFLYRCEHVHLRPKIGYENKNQPPLPICGPTIDTIIFGLYSFLLSLSDLLVYSYIST